MLQKVKDWLPEFFEDIEGNTICVFLDSLKNCEVNSKKEANELINLRIDTTISWLNGFKRK